MVSMQAGRFVPIPFTRMLDPKTGRAKTRLVDIDSTRYHIARRFMIRLRKDDFRIRTSWRNSPRPQACRTTSSARSSRTSSSTIRRRHTGRMAKSLSNFIRLTYTPAAAESSSSWFQGGCSVSTASPVPVVLVRRRFGETTRRDAWWIQPLVVFLGLSAFVVYATWAAFQGDHYTDGPYLSPFYSPELFGSSPHSWFGPKPPSWPEWLPFSPALLILPIPGLFRFTCYYYRGACTTRRFGQRLPPSCAVGEPRGSYRGENSFPLVLQNVHRYMLFISVFVLIILAYDAWKAMWFAGATPGELTFGIGVGTLVLIANVVLLGGYLFGCHSTPHVAGGCVDQLSRAPLGLSAYNCVSCLNRRHMSGPGRALSAWCFQISMSGCFLWVCGRIGGSSDDGYQTHEYDVLVIGSGGAGLRAAIEASASGISVGLVCKSLLGKAHTVMAEGGIAAALGNVDDRDNWKVHFTDTMRGGQYVNNWRMAELHAKEAPDRVPELEAWGALFDRTRDGRILQRNFGGHSIHGSLMSAIVRVSK